MKMDKNEISTKIREAVIQRGCFLVEVSVNKEGDVCVVMESENGIVEMEDCVAVSEAFQQIFNKDVEDYSLTVSSAGLDRPFKILKQYLKAVGTDVTVSLKGGRRLTGKLQAADEEGITLKWQAKETVEGKKKLIVHEEQFPYKEINSTIPHVKFN